MGLSLDPGRVSQDLPTLSAIAGDPRMRPIGLVGGAVLVLVGALLQIAGPSAFWSSVVAGTVVFVGVPLFAMGLAAPEPEGERFQLGIDLTDRQRHVVAVGSVLAVSSPILVAILGALAGFEAWVWLTGGALALVGAILILTGFIAWTSAEIAEPSSSSR